jgi:hypothetical protein
MGALTKIAVLGLGPSIELFAPDNYDLTIGVNDIWRFYKADEIVCLDYPKVFKQDRLKIINDSRPHKFYSQIVAWDHRADFEQIRILPGYPEIAVDLSASGYYKSYCSPFVAVQVAYRVHDAHEIDLYGVDLTNHPHLDSRICLKIKIHFRNLFRALSAQGVKTHVHGNGILTA